ncbi:MAG: DivIVA domain-containing protein [Oscillospiraceae bacterium]|nr:DivIVA domain-containing protein [Oscillospiraceae bacterium]
MLTPNDISSKKFEKSAFGYKPEEVDNFISEILDSYEKAYAEKEAAEEKLLVLAEKLEEYRANEDSLKTVLMGAQKLGDNIVRDSKAKAEVIIAEAENQVKQVFSESEAKIIKEKETIATLQKETAEFKKRLLAMYRQHLELISLMPESNEEKVAEEEVREEEPSAEEIREEVAATEESEEIDFDEVSMAETKRIELDVQE